MTTFVIDTDNNITAFAEREDALQHRAGSTEGTFATEKELTKLTSQWPIGRFVDLWNSFAGAPPFGDLKPVKKFTDRKTAVGRIWRAVQALTPTPAQPVANVAAVEATATEESTTVTGAPKTREGSKKAIVLDMLRRAEGATLTELMAATQWQAHSVRGFISGSLGKKMGLTVESTRGEDGSRRYRLQ
ncbi:MAG: DUF3489 domain-containing protein [Bryobacteraceae bacterium]